MTKPATVEGGTWIGVKRVGSKWYVHAKTWVDGKLVDSAFSAPFRDRATANARADLIAAQVERDLRKEGRPVHHIVIPDANDEPAN